jgi:membrane-associated phospholipid phosphatase
LLQTPPFPEYISGHSVGSAAAAGLLTAFFGDAYAFTDTTASARGFAPRSFSSFNEAAREAALSRLYGGIHYPMGNQEGLLLGECVGDALIDALVD